MYCPRCNARNKAEAGFCEECGMTLISPQTEVLGEPVSQGYNAQLPQFTYGQAPQTNYYASPYQYPGIDPFNPSGQPRRIWAAILGLVLGILSMPSCLCGLAVTVNISDVAIAVSFAINLLVAVSGIIISGIGMSGTKRGVAIAGLVCSIVSVAIALLFLIVAIAAL